jgi:hypothetical protein
MARKQRIQYPGAKPGAKQKKETKKDDMGGVADGEESLKLPFLS